VLNIWHDKIFNNSSLVPTKEKTQFTCWARKKNTVYILS